jgi:unsaturated rhamnogalacturonyl hydrolase
VPVDIQKVKSALLAMQRYSWEQGTAMQAFLEAGDKDTVVAMAKAACMRRSADGLVAEMGREGSAADPLSNGEGLLCAYNICGDPDMAQAYDRCLGWALRGAPRNRDGIIYHLLSKPEMWADSIYMLPPFLSAAGMYAQSLRQIYGYLDLLTDKDNYLLFHIWDDEKQTFTHRVHWGGGNGWAIAGMARVIGRLPAEFGGEKAKLAAAERRLINSVLRYMRKDGLFHDVLDDPGTFVETNCSQMTAYALYKGMAEKWLPDDYLGAAVRLRAAAERMTDEYGFVRGVCAAPTFDRPGVSPEGNAFCILMESAAAKYYAA